MQPSRAQQPIPKTFILTAVQKKNLQKNRKVFETVRGNSYVVSPVLVVCPLCETHMYLAVTGNLWEFLDNLKYFGCRVQLHVKDILLEHSVHEAQ